MFSYSTLQLCILPDTPQLVARAQEIFLDEVLLRSGVKLTTTSQRLSNGSIVIDTIVRIAQLAPELAAELASLEQPGREGFQIAVNTKKNLIVIAGADPRGCIYGAGKLLRKSYLKDGKAALIDGFTGHSATPKYDLRGHQYGCRDKQNTCPCWTNEDFDRYMRDMVLFGNNAAELVPPRTDDELFSPAFKQDPLQMMADWSRIIHSYGMDVWVWYPNMGSNYNLPETRKQEIDERSEVFAKLPYVDAVLIPTGDPGELKPRQFFEVAGEAMQVLHGYHPDAKVYVSPQGFRHTGGEFEAFYEEVARQPVWMYGLCFAPWNRDRIDVIRQNIPEKYRSRIRHYPDITHNASAQYEVPDWDIAFALSHGRESYTCRPKAMKHIHNLHAPYSNGSVTYSEGIHDDVNKIVWADQDFDPHMDCRESVEDYVRYFIDPDLTKPLTDMLMAFEDSWVGDIEKNMVIDEEYRLFREMEKQVGDRVRHNYRFKMAYLRALADYQTKQRAIYDRRLQRDAEATLAIADKVGVTAAVKQARSILNRSYTEPVAYAITQEMFRLAEELFHAPGCRIKLSSKHMMGQSWIRGAWLDCADMPLNDYQWYTQHFKRLLALPDEEERKQYLHWLCNRTNPGEGGHYLCLGDRETLRKHLRSGESWEEDPGFHKSPRITYDVYGIMFLLHRMRGWYDEFPITLNWTQRVRAMYFTPLIIELPKLDPSQSYKLRITYSEMIAPRYPDLDIPATLYANDILIHHHLRRSSSYSECPVYEYDIPREAYEDGKLNLSWYVTGQQRSVSISELWIIKA